jgi:hypothetical protein
MKTPTTLPGRVALAGLLAALTLVGCASGAAPASTPSSSLPPVTDPAPGGGSSGDPGTGIVGPVDPAPVDPVGGQSKLVIAQPGQLNPRPLGASLIETSVDGRHVLVKLTWWSGVELCNVLDSVKIERTGSDIALTIIEGSSDLDVACIDIAEQKATIVDLGDLEPGQYTISSPGGDARPVTITIA